MRDDMHKVIVERPRPGSSSHVARRFRRIDPKRIGLTEEDLDPLPRRIGHKRAASLTGQPKELNENLAPLRRYLAKQIGRPWDKVWSEISSNLRPDNTVQQHVRDHVQDFVAFRTFLRNGKVLVQGRYGGPVPLSKNLWPELYVDPRTGLLCRNRRHRSVRTARRQRETAEMQARAKRLRVVSRNKQLHLLADGNWWEVILAAIPRVAVPSRSGSVRQVEKPVVDAVERARLCSLPRHVRYNQCGVYAVSKRPLSRKEIKVLKLRG
jgi:hypothetical protein